MNSSELPFTFSCNGKNLIAILHVPEKPSNRGLLIVVGGPQYRVGSHRQFVLLARFLAENGIPVFRFDYRAMGDSDGDGVTFENNQDDITAAINEFFYRLPELTNIVMWGLCDAASTILRNAYLESRVTSLILLNPWVRTEEGKARTYIKHYYTKRIFQTEFWQKVLGGKFNWRESIDSFYNMIKQATQNINQNTKRKNVINTLPERMLHGFEKYSGNILFILSGNHDYVADEFRDLVAGSRAWYKLMERKSIKCLLKHAL